ncbi:MAG: CvpA family protein [Steroidobacteraceae bacterium]|nr:CvpA family protein [Steroidobacteraceae bacterium]MDW8258239.1 CvpA family protein [Gammaproteobacteria bacterium]
MGGLDIALSVVVVMSALLGLFRGLLREVISLLTFFLALWIAWAYGDSVAPQLRGGVLAQAPFDLWAARVLLFVGVMLIGTLTAAIVGNFVRLSIFSALDRFLGLVFGLARGARFVGLLVMLGQFLRLDREPWWQQSQLLPYGEASASLLRGFVGEHAPQFGPAARPQRAPTDG